MLVHWEATSIHGAVTLERQVGGKQYTEYHDSWYKGFYLVKYTDKAGFKATRH